MRAFFTTPQPNPAAWNLDKELDVIAANLEVIWQNVGNIPETGTKNTCCEVFLRWICGESSAKQDPIAPVRVPTKCLIAANRQLQRIKEGFLMPPDYSTLHKINALQNQINSLWDEIRRRANELSRQAYCE